MTTEPASPVYVVLDGLGGPWLAIDVGHHTCGTGPGGYYGAHEQGCGLEPVGPIEGLLDHAQAGQWLADTPRAAETVTSVLADHRRLQNARSCSACDWKATAPGRNGDPDTMQARHAQFNAHLATLIVAALTGGPGC